MYPIFGTSTVIVYETLNYHNVFFTFLWYQPSTLHLQLAGTKHTKKVDAVKTERCIINISRVTRDDRISKMYKMKVFFEPSAFESWCLELRSKIYLLLLFPEWVYKSLKRVPGAHQLPWSGCPKVHREAGVAEETLVACKALNDVDLLDQSVWLGYKFTIPLGMKILLSIKELKGF